MSKEIVDFYGDSFLEDQRLSQEVDPIERQFRRIIARDLESGCHENPTDKPEYFTTAYFQHPDELKSEISEAGFMGIRVLAVEGVLWAAKNLRGLSNDDVAWASALNFMKRLEEEKSIIGLSPHLMGVAWKPENK